VAEVAGSFRGRLRIGVSVHSVAEAVAAQQGGADYVMLGPVFETPSKRAYGRPLGVDVLRDACRRVSIPVWAIGGINVSTAPALRGVALAGVAAIAAVIGARDMAGAVTDLRHALGGDMAAARGGALGVEEVCR
jgi:thiamine-phosphate pyrophosphorylase